MGRLCKYNSKAIYTMESHDKMKEEKKSTHSNPILARLADRRTEELLKKKEARE